ncbi:MAG: sigma-70 family RNA polymerase sigma factor, partial [Acidobacteria bacterium]|nr:sigma-70 family RNA polymerase sigma factor [Acidobacteriota bacterium]
RERRAQKRGFGLEAVPIDELNDIAPRQSADVLALHDALNELARTDERKARILELRYFSGLEGEEIAALLEISASTVARELRVAKAWLKTYLSE